MKKILTALFMGAITFSALTKCANAQASDGELAMNSKSLIYHGSESSSFYSANATDVKNVNAKAVDDFRGRFISATDETWYSDKSGFVSVFLSKGYRDRAYYNKKGHWQYSLIFYGEDQLDKDVRAIVKSSYYDMDIMLVEEVQIPEGKGYVIQLQDKSKIKIVKVNSEGEMTTMQEFFKQ